MSMSKRDTVDSRGAMCAIGMRSLIVVEINGPKQHNTTSHTTQQSLILSSSSTVLYLAQVSESREHASTARPVLAVQRREQGLGNPEARLLFA